MYVASGMVLFVLVKCRLLINETPYPVSIFLKNFITQITVAVVLF